MNYIIRQAKKAEARELAELVNHAGKSPGYDGLDRYGWSLNAINNEDPFDVGAGEIAAEEGTYSYNNIRVIECEGRVAALSMSFEVQEKTSEDFKEIPELFHVFKKLTNKIVGSYYLDSLAASPEFRGKGFGKMMLEDTVVLAKGKGYDAIYLLAFDENILAVNIYKKHGFAAIADLPVPKHPQMPYGGRISLFEKNI